jgi:hypothetical protein
LNISPEDGIGLKKYDHDLSVYAQYAMVDPEKMNVLNATFSLCHHSPYIIAEGMRTITAKELA